MSLVIRDATAADAGLIAWVQQEASRSGTPLGFWDVVMPGPDAARLALMSQVALDTGEPSFAHFAGFIVAELDQQPVGALSGYDPRQKKLGHFVGAVDRVLQREGWSPAHRELFWKRAAPAAACMPPAPDDHFVVEWVALKPAARGHGVASELLTTMLQRGRAAGFAKSQISFLIGNDPAQRCYERAGFRVAEEHRHPDFEAIFGRPGIARMTLNLSP